MFFNAASFAQDSSHIIPKKKLVIKPNTDFDQRFSFVEKQDVNIWGYRIGVVVNDKYKTGIGGYFFNQYTNGVRLDADGNPLNKLHKRLYFGTVYYEPYLFKKELVEMSMVFELGYGKAILDSTNKIRQNIIEKEEKQTFIPAGVGVSFNFKAPEIKGLHFLTYVGINTMIGLRKTIFETDLKYNYDGWYWSIGGAFFVDKVFADMKARKQQKLAAQKKPLN